MEREKIQEGMTSFATSYDGNERVRQVSVVLKQHSKKFFSMIEDWRKLETERTQEGMTLS